MRIIHRGGISSGIISPTRVITPPEIPVLKKGMASTVFIGLTFASATDRDGVTVAKFDVKSDRGNTSIEVRPTLGELLDDESTKNMSRSDFDSKMLRLQGIQRISSTFSLSPMSEERFINLPITVLQYMNVVSTKFYCSLSPSFSILLLNSLFYLFQNLIGNWTGKGTFVGTLPASGQEVYIVVKCDPITGSGDMIVCSTDAMAANSITNLLKQALSA